MVGPQTQPHPFPHPFVRPNPPPTSLQAFPQSKKPPSQSIQPSQVSQPSSGFHSLSAPPPTPCVPRFRFLFPLPSCYPSSTFIRSSPVLQLRPLAFDPYTTDSPSFMKRDLTQLSSHIVIWIAQNSISHLRPDRIQLVPQPPLLCGLHP